MAVDVNTVSATSLERLLLAPQGVVAAYGLLGSHVGEEASSISHTGVANSPAAKSEGMDKRYYVLNGLHLGMAVFDVEMTQRCISKQECREANPVMPSLKPGN
ncbi:MAG: hypothetical protein WBX22_13035 [Silvibacterium sp.]